MIALLAPFDDINRRGARVIIDNIRCSSLGPEVSLLLQPLDLRRPLLFDPLANAERQIRRTHYLNPQVQYFIESNSALSYRRKFDCLCEPIKMQASIAMKGFKRAA